MRRSIDRKEQLQVHEHWSSWGLQCPQDLLEGKHRTSVFLEYIEDNSLLLVLGKPLGRCSMLDFFLTNRKGVVGKVKLKVSLGCSDHEMMKFKGFRAGRRMHSKVWPGLEESRLGSLQGTARCRPWKEEGPDRHS